MRNTLTRARGQIIGWGFALGLYAGFITALYKDLVGMQDQFAELLKNYPEELLAFMGDVDKLFTPGGYLNTYVFLYMPLIIGVYVLSAGSALLAGDEEKGVLDLLVTYPVSRTRLFFGRLLGLVIAIALILLTMWLGFLPGLSAAKMDISAGDMILPILSLFGTLLFFTTLALLLSMLLPASRLASVTAGLILVASFFSTLLATMNPDAEIINKLLPLAYYQGGDALTGMNWGWLGGLLGASVLFSLVGLVLFQRREIRIAGERGWELPQVLTKILPFGAGRSA